MIGHCRGILHAPSHERAPPNNITRQTTSPRTPVRIYPPPTTRHKTGVPLPALSVRNMTGGGRSRRPRAGGGGCVGWRRAPRARAEPRQPRGGVGGFGRRRGGVAQPGAGRGGLAEGVAIFLPSSEEVDADQIIADFKLHRIAGVSGPVVIHPGFSYFIRSFCACG